MSQDLKTTQEINEIIIKKLEEKIELKDEIIKLNEKEIDILKELIRDLQQIIKKPLV